MTFVRSYTDMRAALIPFTRHVRSKGHAGDGAIERIAFANFCGEGRTTAQLKTIALELIKNTAGRATAIIESQWRAAERVSFQAVQKQLAILFSRIANHS